MKVIAERKNKIVYRDGDKCIKVFDAEYSKADVAAAACHSVSEQVYEQQLQEIDIREPLIQVGGTSLISGLVEAVSETLGGIEIIVPEYSQHIGAVGAALLVSGMGHRQDNK